VWCGSRSFGNNALMAFSVSYYYSVEERLMVAVEPISHKRCCCLCVVSHAPCSLDALMTVPAWRVALAKESRVIGLEIRITSQLS
jgi:hypothetical protein